MIKKLFLAILIAFSFQIGALSLPVYAALDPSTKNSTTPASDLRSGDFMFDLQTVTHEGIKGSSQQNWIRRGINYLFERAISIMATVIGSLAVLMMSAGGFKILYSGGNETEIGKGKNMIMYSLIGVAAALGAYVMVTAVQLLIKSIWSS